MPLYLFICLSACTNSYVSTTDWIQNYKDSHLLCEDCNQCPQCTYSFSRIPDLIVFEFEGKDICIDPEVTITCRNNQSCNMKLQGVICYGEQHYTSRVLYGWNLSSTAQFQIRKVCSIRCQRTCSLNICIRSTNIVMQIMI